MNIKHVLFAIALLFCTTCFAQTSIKGYYKKDGTYVAPHQRTRSNNTAKDNYSRSPNVNPYTGKKGHVNDNYTPTRTGTRGGQYYINSNGKKTYIRNK